MNAYELMMNTRVSLSRNILIHSNAFCMRLAVCKHALVHVSPPDWPAFHLSETHRFDQAPDFKIFTVLPLFHLIRLIIFYFNFYFTSYANLTKIISHSIFVQLMWDFLHFVPLDL